MNRLYLDTETIGLVGIIDLIQYARGNEKPNLYYLFDEPVSKTLELIDSFTQDIVVGFNLNFDWFHLVKLVNILKLVQNKNIKPIPQELWDIEHDQKNPEIRKWCIKPAGCLDLYLHALKGPYQSVMDRKPLNIRKIPRFLAENLVRYLNEKIRFKKIFFANKKDNTSYGWEIKEIGNDNEGKIGDPDFVNLVLRFKPSAGLKILCADAFNQDYKLLEEINELQYPEEEEWCPYHLNKQNSWLSLFKSHYEYWKCNDSAIKYATDDIILTRNLDNYFGTPNHSDDDSCLACSVAVCRWHGFTIDNNVIDELLPIYQRRSLEAPKSPREAKAYIGQHMTDIEKLALTGTSLKVLEQIEEWADISEEEEDRFNDLRDEADIQEFIKWRNLSNNEPHLASLAAIRVLNARRADKRIDIINKLTKIGRLHPNFRIIGAKSGRMSGTGGLNPHGMPKQKEFRAILTLADIDFQLDGGDFDQFEISIADAVYDDPIMRAELKAGKKFHACFGAEIYKSNYDIIKEDEERYSYSKNGVFCLLYGGQEQKLADTLHVDLETAQEGYRRFANKYKNVAKKRAEIIDKFCSMKQPSGIGTKVEWHEPDDYIETIFGFRRYFTLENQTCKALFNMANDLPDDIKNVKVKVKRRDRFQTAGGAICSALYAGAFNIQSGNMRAAANHVIQGSGCQITKNMQRKIWDTQPVGIHEYVVLTFNSHDEILAPNKRSNQIKETVEGTLNFYRPHVPLLGMTWKQGMKSWAEK